MTTIETDDGLWELALAKVDQITLAHRGQANASGRSAGMWAQNPTVNVTTHLTLSIEGGEVLLFVITVRAPAKYAVDQEPSVQVQQFTGHHDDFWLVQLNKDDARRVVVNGCHYRLGPDRPDTPKELKGFAGRYWDIEYLDGRPPVVTNDLWYQGKIPEKYRQLLPDNARFVW